MPSARSSTHVQSPVRYVYEDIGASRRGDASPETMSRVLWDSRRIGRMLQSRHARKCGAGVTHRQRQPVCVLCKQQWT